MNGAPSNAGPMSAFALACASVAAAPAAALVRAGTQLHANGAAARELHRLDPTLPAQAGPCPPRPGGCRTAMRCMRHWWPRSNAPP
ncbi:MAG: hypothetical protein MUC68_15835 [Burkholderiaceae bacterium]|nr:hypothetical protein [Burkholderiaceae bacterium]